MPQKVSNSLLLSQEACISEGAPEAMSRFRTATNYTNMRDRKAPPLPQEAVCTSDNRLAASSAAEPIEQFRVLRLSVWRRIYGGELLDNVLIALCTLMATAAAGAAILRLVRWRKGATLTVFSLRRELVYTSVFALTQFRLHKVFQLCGRRRPAQQGLADDRQGSGAGSLPLQELLRILCLVGLPAAVLWLVIEVRCCLVHACVLQLVNSSAAKLWSTSIDIHYAASRKR